MVLDVLKLRCPTALIHPKCFSTPVGGNLVESGFGDQKEACRSELAPV
jgi:hypothetical protein